VKNTADVIGDKLIVVLLKSISVVSATNPLVGFYDINGGKREVLFFYFVTDITRDRTDRPGVYTEEYSLIVIIGLGCRFTSRQRERDERPRPLLDEIQPRVYLLSLSCSRTRLHII
jgi:hypothetical protein